MFVHVLARVSKGEAFTHHLPCMCIYVSFVVHFSRAFPLVVRVAMYVLCASFVLWCEYVYGIAYVCTFSRPLPLGRVAKLGVLPTDALAPLNRLALRYLLIPRGLSTPPSGGAVKLWPRCPLEPLNLFMSRGFGRIA